MNETIEEMIRKTSELIFQEETIHEKLVAQGYQVDHILTPAFELAAYVRQYQTQQREEKIKSVVMIPLNVVPQADTQKRHNELYANSYNIKS